MSRTPTQYVDFFCDAKDCDATVRIESAQAPSYADLPAGWLKVELSERVYQDPDDFENLKTRVVKAEGEFCSRMCAARFVTGIEIAD